jgi:hypothetical protein
MKFKEFRQQINDLKLLNPGVDLDDFDVVVTKHMKSNREILKIIKGKTFGSSVHRKIEIITE